MRRGPMPRAILHYTIPSNSPVFFINVNKNPDSFHLPIYPSEGVLMRVLHGSATISRVISSLYLEQAEDASLEYAR